MTATADIMLTQEEIRRFADAVFESKRRISSAWTPPRGNDVRDEYENFRGDRSRRPSWRDLRASQDAPVVDRVVSQVRVIDRHHALFGQTLPVLSLKPARGARFVTVQLLDGRKRSILRSVTDVATEPSPQDLDSTKEGLRVSVRTLLPLVRLLAALRPQIEENGDDGATSFDATASDGSGPRIPSGGAEIFTTVEGVVGQRPKPGRVDRRRHGEAHGGERSGGAT